MDETSSHCLLYLGRLFDFHDALTLILAPNNATYSSASVYYASMMGALESNLARKASLYDNVFAERLFIINNYHYLVKACRSRPDMAQRLGESGMLMLETRLEQAKDSYMNEWSNVVQGLDGDKVGGAGVLDASERQAIKDK